MRQGINQHGILFSDRATPCVAHGEHAGWRKHHCGPSIFVGWINEGWLGRNNHDGKNTGRMFASVLQPGWLLGFSDAGAVQFLCTLNNTQLYTAFGV